MGFMDKARQLADEAAAKAQVVAADAKEKSGPALEKAKIKAGELEEKAQPTIQKAEQELEQARCEGVTCHRRGGEAGG